jgi:transposase
MRTTPIHVGIDVAKDRLDVVLRPTGEYLELQNSDTDIRKLIGRLAKADLDLVVLEATGGLEQPAATALALAGLPVAIVNPRQVRDFAKAVGRLAKTDRIDAAVLAHFAEAVRPEPRPLGDEQAKDLSAIVLRRRQVLGMITAETNRLSTAPKAVKRRIESHLRWLRKELERVNAELEQRVRNSSLSGARKTSCSRACPGWVRFFL